jgi:hypothetical protein
MPEFRCRWDARRGALQLRHVFERIQMNESIYRSSPFTRLSELKHLQATRQLDSHLLWAVMEEQASELSDARSRHESRATRTILEQEPVAARMAGG